MNFRTLASIVPAFAALAVAAIPASALAEPFEGEYLGVTGGASITKSSGTIITGPVDETSTKPLAVLVAGYRSPIGKNSPIVIGVEGDFGALIDDFDTRLGVSAIAGYRLGDKALIYGRGGYATLGGVDQNDTDSSLDGFMFGGGAEFNLLKRLNLRVDYRYTDYGNGAPDILDNRLAFEGHEITGGVILDF